MASMPDQSAPAPRPQGQGGVGFGSDGKKAPEIIVIPEKFYGVALKLDGRTDAESAIPPSPLPPTPAPPKSPMPPMSTVSASPGFWRSHGVAVSIMAALVFFLAGGFVYLNRDLLFKKPAIVRPPVAVPPAAPTYLTATSTSPASVALSWTDAARNEDGYRIERRTSGGSFLPLTTVPAGSDAFLDISAQAGTTYDYQVVAVNGAGESAPSGVVTIAVLAAIPIAIVEVTTSTQPQLPPGGLDSDADGLTDIEEPLYQTDMHNPDTDGDGFLDGNEVFHLYNPSANAPVRLLDSGLVKQVTATIGWAILIPAEWSATFDAADGAEAKIVLARPERLSVSVLANPGKLSPKDWYVARMGDAGTTPLRSFTTKQGIEGAYGIDRLEAFFPWNDSMLAIRYDLSGQPYINYRETFEMVLNSLKLSSGTPTPSP